MRKLLFAELLSQRRTRQTPAARCRERLSERTNIMGIIIALIWLFGFRWIDKNECFPHRVSVGDMYHVPTAPHHYCPGCCWCLRFIHLHGDDARSVPYASTSNDLLGTGATQDKSPMQKYVPFDLSPREHEELFDNRVSFFRWNATNKRNGRKTKKCHFNAKRH